SGDRWTVGGGAPTSLPAGRLDGTAIRGQATHSTVVTSPTVDTPTETAPTAAATDTTVSGSPGSATAGSVTPQDATALNGRRREIFGFLPYWEVNSSSLRLDYAKISTIAYFGVGADDAGNLQKRTPDAPTTVGLT